MFALGEEGDAAEMKARLGTFFLGVAGTLGTFTAFVILKWAGRVLMMGIGEVAMGL